MSLVITSAHLNLQWKPIVTMKAACLCLMLTKLFMKTCTYRLGNWEQVVPNNDGANNRESNVLYVFEWNKNNASFLTETYILTYIYLDFINFKKFQKNSPYNQNFCSSFVAVNLFILSLLRVQNFSVDIFSKRVPQYTADYTQHQHEEKRAVIFAEHWGNSHFRAKFTDYVRIPVFFLPLSFNVFC